MSFQLQKNFSSVNVFKCVYSFSQAIQISECHGGLHETSENINGSIPIYAQLSVIYLVMPSSICRVVFFFFAFNSRLG